MERIIHRKHTWAEVACVVIVIVCLVGMTSPVIYAIAADPEMRVRLAVGLLLAIGTMAWIGIRVLQSIRRYRLVFSDEALVEEGRRRREFRWNDVTALHWLPHYTRPVRLETATQRITIRLNEHERDDVLWMIRHLRRVVPEDRQKNWDEFCHRTAVPLRDHDPKHPQLREPGDYLVKRARYDRIGAISTIVVTLIVGVILWRFDMIPELRRAIGVLPVLVFAGWQLLRWTTPRQGMVVRRRKNVPADNWILIISAVAIVVAILPVLFMDNSRGLNEGMNAFLSTAALMAFVPFLACLAYFTQRAQKQRRERDAPNVARAVAQWEARERHTAGATSAGTPTESFPTKLDGPC